MPVRDFLNRLNRLVTRSFLVVAISGIHSLSVFPIQDSSQVQFRQFDFLTATSGWILLGQHLFWTTDAGETWLEITPDLPLEASIQVVDFLDENTGWVLWTTLASDASSLFQLSYTSNHGMTWVTHPLSLFEPGDPASFAEKAQMGWFDSQTGWISVKQSSGSNFSLGTLFITTDGGASWKRNKLPVADQVYFAGADRGWAVGGPAGDQVFETQDGGSSWKDVSPQYPANNVVTTYVPFFSEEEGVLVTTQLGSENFVNLYQYSNGQWSLLEQVKLDGQPGVIGISILDPQRLMAVIPGKKSILRLENLELSYLTNTDDLSASIVDLDMLTLEVGWAKSIQSDCSNAFSPDDQAASVSCTASTRLLRTSNGGVTWDLVVLPIVETSVTALEAIADSNNVMAESLPNLGNSKVFIGQGFDKCELPTVSQLQTWWDSSPYKAVNLYIGGSNRACDNLPLSATYLKTIHQQGWKFFPTWVGPQAPCTGYSARISSDTSIAFDQGVAEADQAVERLAELGLTYPDKTGSVVYYDIEYYGTGPACRDAVKAFMNGWVSQIRARGNLAGVYGSTLCDTGLSDFLNIPNVPDVIWPASWYHNQGDGFYDPEASVWDLGRWSCIPATAWADHQRIRQYEGDHFQTWGDLTLGIDVNVLDGVVAVPYALPFVRSIAPTTTNLSNLDQVIFKVRFSRPVTGLDSSDFVLTTNVPGTAITQVTGSGRVYYVTVSTGTGDGTIRLDIMDDDSIVDATGFPLGGAGLDNGNFTDGQVYTKPIKLESIGIQDGWILESNETSTAGGGLNTGSTILKLGDNVANKQLRAILSFETPTLPEGSVITAITLRIKRAGVAGVNPFLTHGNLFGDLCRGSYQSNANLELGDFSAVCSKNKALIFTNYEVDTWYSQFINSMDYQFINFGGLTQFRLRFKLDDNNDFGADYLKIFSGDATDETDRPQLIIEYYVP